MTAAGYSDQRPVADNATADGRSRNRRVTIQVESMSPEVANAPSTTTEVSVNPQMRNVDGALGTPENTRLAPREEVDGAP